MDCILYYYIAREIMRWRINRELKRRANDNPRNDHGMAEGLLQRGQ